jgi:hypothetical protein
MDWSEHAPHARVLDARTAYKYTIDMGSFLRRWQWKRAADALRKLRFVGVVAPLVVGCKTPEPAPFTVRMHVESDPGIPLAGVIVQVAGKEATKSDARGNADLRFTSPDGTALELAVKCPGDRRSVDPLAVGVRRTADGKPVEYTVVCKPIYRTVVVAVRAEAGPNLPIFHLNDQVGQTDADGAAHFSLTLRPGESVPIRFDTSANEKMLPQSPTRTFLVKDVDSVEVVSAKFEVPKVATVRGGGYHAPLVRRSREIPINH